jgi:signal transduction histidine kinase
VHQQTELVIAGENELTLEIIGTCSFAQSELDPLGQPSVTIVYTLRDISARKRLEAAEAEAKEAAIAANTFKTQLIANMSHELRTPLNGVIGFSQILKNESLGPLGVSEYKEYAERIHESGNRLLTVFNDMLNIAKLDSGDFVLCTTAVSLKEAVESSTTKFESRAEDEGKLLRLEIEENATAKLDVSVFREVLTHLISNALKYTRKGGEIVVRAARDGPDLILEVEDNGCGAPIDCLPKLTDVFYQADAALNRKYEGAGLGLYVVSKFVELHNGELSFESELEQGFLARVRILGAVSEMESSVAA